MEIFQQLRLLLILVMAFLSYQYVGTQPLSLTASEEDEQEVIDSQIPIEENVADAGEPQDEQLQEEHQNIDGSSDELEEREEFSNTHGKQINTQPAITGELSQQGGAIEQEEGSASVLHEVQNEEEEDENGLKTLKTKQIRRNWKRASKLSIQNNPIPIDVDEELIE